MMGGESRGRVSEDERGERQSAVRVSGIEAHMQYSAANSYTYIYIYILLAVKPAFGGLHSYGAPSTAALQRRSGECDSMTEP